MCSSGDWWNIAKFLKSSMVFVWYSAPLGHGFMATLLPTCGRSEGPPLSKGVGTLEPPPCIKSIYSLTILLCLI